MGSGVGAGVGSGEGSGDGAGVGDSSDGDDVFDFRGDITDSTEVPVDVDFCSSSDGDQVIDFYRDIADSTEVPVDVDFWSSNDGDQELGTSPPLVLSPALLAHLNRRRIVRRTVQNLNTTARFTSKLSICVIEDIYPMKSTKALLGLPKSGVVKAADLVEPPLEETIRTYTTKTENPETTTTETTTIKRTVRPTKRSNGDGGGDGEGDGGNGDADDAETIEGAKDINSSTPVLLNFVVVAMAWVFQGTAAGICHYTSDLATQFFHK